ncbi:MAG: serine hydrolase [Gammaproteobacteria bacterium]|nr:serine hydrolase [Gammaproteobacteria bacterium]
MQYVAFCFLALVSAVSVASEQANRVTALFQHFDEGVQPGAAVMVVRDGEIIYSKGFGHADLENHRRIDADSSFRLASVSKQFTAMAIMVLAEDGKLDYDDPVVDYIPSLSNYPGVTIRHLLTHTAGLPDYYDAIDTSAGRPVTADMPAVLAAMNGPVFAPGEKYEYSNPAYEMLALVVEAASGMPFRDFMASRVFAPAGMDDSLIRDESQPEIANRVIGYAPDGDAYAEDDDDPLNYIIGSGGMYATLEDFLAWDRALYDASIVSAETLAEGYTRHRLNSGETIDYGFGWRLDHRRGHQRVAHGGSWVGFRTGIARYPDEKLAIVVLTNRADGTPGDYIDRITDIYLPEAAAGYVDEGTAWPAAFESGNTVATIQRQMRRLPDDDIWWAVNGKDMAWNFRNLHLIFPTAPVHRNGPVRELKRRPMPEIAEFRVDTPDGPMRFESFIESDLSTAMGIVILHKGDIVFERYPRMREHEQPVYWSTSKIFPATVIRLLEERGLVDVERPIDEYIPELANSSFAGTPVRHILDMASGLDCSDEYDDRNSCYYLYSMAIGDGFRTESAPDSPYDFAATYEATREAPSGEKFSYSGLNTFILGWLVEKVMGMPFQDAFSKEIWSRIGAESDAAYIAPRYGIPVTHGGFVSRMRDLARFGLLFTPSYDVVSDEQIITDAHIELRRHGGDPALRLNAGLPGVGESGVRHNIYQWDEIYEDDTFFKGGWAGQGLAVNPTRDTVVVFASYFKDDFTEVRLESKVFEVMNGVFGKPGAP